MTSPKETRKSKKSSASKITKQTDKLGVKRVKQYSITDFVCGAAGVKKGVKTVKAKRRSKQDQITSPEYKMSQLKKDRRLTRNNSQKGKEELLRKQNNGESDIEEDSQEEEEEDTHSAILPCPEPIDVEEFDKEVQEERMGNILSVINALCNKVTEMDISINHDTLGLMTRITTVQQQADQNTSGRTKTDTDIIAIQNTGKILTEEIAGLKRENKTLKGIVQRYGKQLCTLNDRIASLTARSMENNLTVHGIVEEKKEDCKQKFVDFLKKEVEIDVSLDEVIVAHRAGKSVKGRNRTIIARCIPALKERVMKNKHILKEKTGDKGQIFYINRQLPDK